MKYHTKKGEIAEFQIETKHDGPLRFEGEHYGPQGHNLVVETREPTYLLVDKNANGEVDDQNKGDGGVEEISEKGCL